MHFAFITCDWRFCRGGGGGRGSARLDERRGDCGRRRAGRRRAERAGDGGIGECRLQGGGCRRRGFRRGVGGGRL